MHNRYKLLILSLLFALVTLMCSSGYITPASLTATAAATLVADTPFPTAFLASPTSTETAIPIPSETPDPQLFTPTPNLPTLTAAPATEAPTITPDVIDASTPPIIYMAQSGDSLDALVARFGVNPFEIVSDEPIPEKGFIKPGQLLVIPSRLNDVSPNNRLIPDSDLVYSPSATDFVIDPYVTAMGGYLSSYREYLGSTGWLSGAEIVEKVATDNSINPRILLSLLEFQGHWVLGQPHSLGETDYPMGYIVNREKGLHSQLTYAVNQLSTGYYNWRGGRLTHLIFTDGMVIRVAPELNAGTVAVHYYFSQIYTYAEYFQVIDLETGIAAQHNIMFGDAWTRAASIEPLLPASLEQPELILPFVRGQTWGYTGGPHGAWERKGAMAALDFAPGSILSGCVPSELWMVAVAPGIIARRDDGVVVIDLDGDGNEQTGWAVLYLHVASSGAPPVGKWVEKGDLIGHPSCEGGVSTGTHLHIARKYNGEWIEAGGPLPFELSGWVADAGNDIYLGSLTRGDKTIEACTCGSYATNIKRTEDDPY